MTLLDFLNASQGTYRIVLYEGDESNFPICYVKSTWKGIVPYLDRNIIFFKIETDPRSCEVEVEIHLAEKEK